MTDKINGRELVLSILLSVTRDGEYSHIALKQTLDKYQYLDKQERSFITRVCEGTLEHMIYIDYVINKFSSVKAAKMKPVIRTILRFSVYELKYMDSVPKSATCNEAVKLAVKKGFASLKGFVNGVLRNISRNLDDIALPDKEKSQRQWLSVTYSMPEWILEKWEKSYSFEQIEEMLQAFLSGSPTSIRVNTARISRQELKTLLQKQGLAVTENDAVSDGLFLSGYDHLMSVEAFVQGLFYVQDTSSMLVAHRAGVKSGDYVIDVCAAPGGKSIHMAQLLEGSGMVEARDLTEYKINLIRENVKRSGLTNIRAVIRDARSFPGDGEEKADIVIADLPCSGLGVIGKKKDIKYKMTPEKQAELAELQRQILHASQLLVKKGGVLMYSTCTINPDENEGNTAWFLKEHPAFVLEEQEQILPKAGKNDGFFIARMIKTEEHGKNGH